MGVHTGDSITVAPAHDSDGPRVSDSAGRGRRGDARHRRRHRRIDVQFAVHPETGRAVVIEMNPRVSRSSARRRKATGFHREDRRQARGRLHAGRAHERHHRTDPSPAFEPTLDYVVVKWPRFAFEKFPGADPRLTTTMKSVGEAMSVGRNFVEVLQKALRSMETTESGFWTTPDPGGSTTSRGPPGKDRDTDGRPNRRRRAGVAGRRQRRTGLRKDRDLPVGPPTRSPPLSTC